MALFPSNNRRSSGLRIDRKDHSLVAKRLIMSAHQRHDFFTAPGEDRPLAGVGSRLAEGDRLPAGVGSLLAGVGMLPAEVDSLLAEEGMLPAGVGSLLVEEGMLPAEMGSLLAEEGSRPAAEENRRLAEEGSRPAAGEDRLLAAEVDKHHTVQVGVRHIGPEADTGPVELHKRQEHHNQQV